jgi:hypothetical protein
MSLIAFSDPSPINTGVVPANDRKPPASVHAPVTNP